MPTRNRMSVIGASIVFAIGLIAAALVIHARSTDFIKAAAWHKAHGDALSVDGHKLNLPQDWYSEGMGAHGMPRLFKASNSITKVSQSVIDFNQKGPQESHRSGEEIRQALELMVAHDKLRTNEMPKTSLVTVTAVSTKMYCIKTLLAKEELGLRCNVVNSPLVINSAGPPETEHEILSILSSFN